MTASPSSKKLFPDLDTESWAADPGASALIENLRQRTGFAERVTAARALCAWLKSRGLDVPESLKPPPWGQRRPSPGVGGRRR
jgi:hypothetical protein